MIFIYKLVNTNNEYIKRIQKHETYIAAMRRKEVEDVN